MEGGGHGLWRSGLSRGPLRGSINLLDRDNGHHDRKPLVGVTNLPRSGDEDDGRCDHFDNMLLKSREAPLLLGLMGGDLLF